MSWPCEVVPSQWAADGPRPGGKSIAVGLYGAIWPGKIASTIKNSNSSAPMLAFGLRRRARHNLPPRLGWETPSEWAAPSWPVAPPRTLPPSGQRFS